MAISPPGDIVLNVARAASPEKLAAAQRRLQAHAGESAGLSFTLNASEPSAPPRGIQGADTRPEPLVKFEAMVLQNFLQTMLPEDTTALYGEGMAGEMWRSLLAQQLSETMAERGGLGIAERVLGDHYKDNDKKVPIGAVSSGPEKAEADRQALLSTALVQEIERRAAQTLGVGAPPANRDNKEET